MNAIVVYNECFLHLQDQVKQKFVLRLFGSSKDFAFEKLENVVTNEVLFTKRCHTILIYIIRCPKQDEENMELKDYSEY